LMHSVDKLEIGVAATTTIEEVKSNKKVEG
jgi:hypothetical protein